MGFSLPSLSNIGNNIGNFVQQAAEKVASAVTQQPASQPTPPAAAQQPVDSFEPSSPNVNADKPALCGGNSSEGAQCLPTWGKDSGGGGSGAGINPSRGAQ